MTPEGRASLTSKENVYDRPPNEESVIRAAKPVFVDRSGRRRRAAVAAGAGLAAFLLVGLAFLIVGLSGVAPLDLPGFPAAGGQAGPSSTPTPRPTRTPDARPSTQPTETAKPATTQASTVRTAVPTTAAPSPTKPGKKPTSQPSHPPRPTRSS